VLSAMYSVLGVGLALSYVPQAIAAWRDRGSAESLSLAAWSFWTCHGADGLLYMATVVRVPVLVILNTLSLTGCAATTTIVVVKRLRHRASTGELERTCSESKRRRLHGARGDHGARLRHKC
jgi:hypothetical protein